MDNEKANKNDGSSSSDYKPKWNERDVAVDELEDSHSVAASLTDSQNARNFAAMQAEKEAEEKAALQASAQKPKRNSSQQHDGDYKAPRRSSSSMRGIVGNSIIEEQQKMERKERKERKQARKQKQSRSASLSSAPDEDDAEMIDTSSNKKPQPLSAI